MGSVRHVSGLTFGVLTLRPGKEGTLHSTVTLDQKSLAAWEMYELASGTPTTQLRERKDQLQREALAYVNQ